MTPNPFENIAAELERVAESAAAELQAIGESAASEPRKDGAWSRKQVLGHLIDSASNNHQRFIRLQAEPAIDLPGYEQETWVLLEHFESRQWQDLVELWLAYNRHLAHVLRHADPRSADHMWRGPEGDLTFQFIAGDYLRHLQHHLRQILL